MDMNNLVTTAWGAKRLRQQTTREVVANMRKAFSLSEDDAVLLEQCLIELTLNISQIGPYSGDCGPTTREAISLYRQAVLNEGGVVKYRDDECSALAMEKALETYLINQSKY